MQTIESRRGLGGLSGKVWPDGSFGYAFRRKQSYREPSSYELRRNEDALIRALREVRASDRASYYFAAKGILPLGFLLPSFLKVATRVSFFGLSEITIYHKKPRNPRGARGITPRQRKAVRSAVGLLEFRYGRKNLSFGTLTLPGLSREDRLKAQQRWARSVQVFFQSLRRHFERAGLTFSYAAVTEIHPKRSAREGWNAPHLHFVFFGRVNGKWIITPQQIRKYWQRAWRGHLSGQYDWRSSENLVSVRKSAGAYLAKYLSKGRASLSAKSQVDFWSPSAWVSISSGLKSWVAQATVSILSVSGIFLEKQTLRSIFSRFGEKLITATNSNGCEMGVGVSGWVPSNEWLEILGAFWPEKLSPPIPV